MKRTFVCKSCGKEVSYEAPGTKNRNHCPHCLHSRHVDITRGDRKSQCGGVMKPIGMTNREDGEQLIVHQCRSCGFVNKNRVAGDDDEKVLKNLSESGVGDRLV